MHPQDTPRRAPGALALAIVLAGPLPLQAQDRGASARDAATLDAIVVTAEKTDRSLKDTATSVVVFDGDELMREGLNGSQALLGQLANVTVVGPGTNLAPAVRGVDGTGAAAGIDAFFAGSRARFNLQVDGRAASFNEIVFGDAALWDVETATLLRGAQSTLQGRNAYAGTLAIKTRDPSWTPEGAVQLGGGNFDARQAAAMVSGPLVDDRLAGRIAVSFDEHDSFVRGFQDDYVHKPDGTRLDGSPGLFRNVTARGKLLWRMADDAQTLFTLNHSEQRMPHGEYLRPPFKDHLTTDLEGDYPVFNPRSTSVIADTRVGLGERWRFENLLSYTALDIKRYAAPGEGNAGIDGREWAWEPRLHYRAGEGRTGAVFGAYLFRAEQDERLDFPVVFIPETFDDDVRNEAAFADATVQLGDRVDLIAGARYERERHRRSGGDGLVVRFEPVDQSVDTFLPKLGLAFHPDDAWTLGMQASRGYNGGGGGIAFAVQPPPQGAPPGTPPTVFIQNYVYDPEYVTTFEGFARAELAGGRLFLTANVFQSDYRDMQLPFKLFPDPSNFATVIYNADKVRTRGAEFGARWRAGSRLELGGEVGLLRSEIVRFPNPFPAGGSPGLEGRELPRSPHLTAGGTLRWWTDAGFDLGLRLHYTDDYFSSDVNQPTRIDGYWLANLDAGWTFGDVRLFAYAHNLFDEAGYTEVAFSGTSALVVQPRRVGVGVQWRF